MNGIIAARVVLPVRSLLSALKVVGETYGVLMGVGAVFGVCAGLFFGAAVRNRHNDNGRGALWLVFGLVMVVFCIGFVGAAQGWFA